MSAPVRARARDLRLLAVAVPAWAAAVVVTSAPEASPALGAALWAATGLVLVCAARWRVVAWLPPAAVALAAASVVATHVALAQPARERALSLPTEGGRALIVEAAVTGKVERGLTGWRFDAVSQAVSIGDDHHALAVPVTVRSSDRPPGLDLGSQVTLTGTAFVADPAERAVWVVDASRLVVRHPPSGPLAVAAEARAGLIAQTRELPQPGAGLIAGLAVGDTAAVGPDLDEDMKTASLSHLTAVSGANCALVVGIAYALAAGLGARRAGRVVAGLCALGGFVVLVSPEPSVVRAAAMAAIAMLALLLGRPGAGASVLGLAVTLCLALDPWLSTTLGFALSAAATSALLLLAAPMSLVLSRFMPQPLALAIAVPLSAQLACTPLLIAIDPRMPLYAVIANMLATPAAPAATVLGLAACLAAPVPVLAAGLAGLAWLPCAWIAATAQTFASMPASSLPWWSGAVGVAAAVVVSAAGIVWLTPVRPAARVTAAGVLALFIGVGAGTAVLDGPIRRIQAPQGWSVAVCDVGQGDALVLRSAGAVALIDTGPEPGALSACLDLFGVSRVDVLVLTHFDLDHRGGADAVLHRTDLLVHGPASSPADDELVARFHAAGAQVRQASAGMTGTLGDARWRVLWPRGRSVGYPPGNDASVVVDVRGGGIPATLLLGDLSESPQRALARELTGRYDVVKVAHHGSADQHHDLYRRSGASLAVVTVGENDYGHPRSEILDLLRSLGLSIVRTDETGAAAVVVREGELHVWRERPPEDDGPGPAAWAASAPPAPGTIRPRSAVAGGG